MATDTTNALIDLTTLKNAVSESGSGNDTRLEAVIDAVSWHFNRRTGRNLLYRAYSDDDRHRYSGDGTSRLFLRDWPVDTDQTFTLYISGDAPRVWDADSQISSDDYEVDERMGVVEFLEGSVFTKGHRNIRVDMTAGYGAAANPAAIPYDLKRAVLMMCQSLWHAENNPPRTSSISVAGASVTVDLDQAEPAFVKEVLDAYRRYSW